MTLQTVADRVGVSRMTVSNAFSRPDQLSSKLRRRILDAAAELRYVGPDPAARALARGATGAVGVLLTESLRFAFTDEVATSFLAAIAEELAPTGLALTLLTTSTGQDDVVPARDVAMDGALVYSCETGSAALDWLMRRRLPLVFVDQSPAPGIPSVNVEDRLGARAAAQHLIDLGHRRVGILTSGADGPYGLVADPLAGRAAYPPRQRMLGWLDVLDPAGIRPTVVRQTPYSERVDEGARLLLDNDEPPTAVLCFSDAIASGVVRTAEDLGLRVPADLSVVGFDDNPLAERIRPGLTTVRQDIAAKGRAAVAALTAAIESDRDGATGRARHVRLPTELVVRESTTGPPTRV
ncbi:MAG: LacI family DNA-binding transcriptional regulator [Jiangellaceae bacterium]